MKCFLAVIALSVLLLPATLTGQEGGLTTQWNIRETLKSLNAQTGRLLALLEQVDPAAWTDKGASESYVDQWKGLTADIGYLQRVEGRRARRCNISCIKNSLKSGN